MNAIFCELCHAIMTPTVNAGCQKCHCGTVEMRAVHPDEGLPYLVEVKLNHYYLANEPDKQLKAKAKVIKINNHFLSGELDYHEFFSDQRDKNDLFYQNRSHIVIAPLDTPGVQVVEEFTKKTKNTLRIDK